MSAIYKRNVELSKLSLASYSLCNSIVVSKLSSVFIRLTVAKGCCHPVVLTFSTRTHLKLTVEFMQESGTMVVSTGLTFGKL
jgi:hypothetical protein